MATTICPHLNLWNLGTCSETQQRGTKVAEGIKIAKSTDPKIGRLSWIIWVDPVYNHKALESGRQSRDGSIAAQYEVGPTSLALKMENGTRSRGAWAAPRCWKWQGYSFSPGASRKGHSPANALIFTPRNPCQTTIYRTVR